MSTPVEYSYFQSAVFHTHLTSLFIFCIQQAKCDCPTDTKATTMNGIRQYLSLHFAKYATRPRNCRKMRQIYINFLCDASIFREMKFDLDFTHSTGYLTTAGTSQVYFHGNVWCFGFLCNFCQSLSEAFLILRKNERDTV